VNKRIGNFGFWKPFLKISHLFLASASAYSLLKGEAWLHCAQFTSLPPILMSKQDLINAIANAAGITKRAASDALESIIGTITSELKKGRNVTVTGFGTFRVSHRAARMGVNPRNPTQKISIPAMKVPAFKAGKSLKDAIR